MPSEGPAGVKAIRIEWVNKDRSSWGLSLVRHIIQIALDEFFAFSNGERIDVSDDRKHSDGNERCTDRCGQPRCAVVHGHKIAVYWPTVKELLEL